MLAQPRPGASASSSAFTSSHGRRTIWKRSFRSPSLTASCTTRPNLPAEFPQQPFITDYQKRLIGRFQQIKERTVDGTRVDFMTVRQKLHASAAAGGLEQAHAELLFERPHDG